MTNSKRQQNPTMGGVVKRRNKMPMLSGTGDTAVLRYRAMGLDASSGTVVGAASAARYYVCGYPAGLSNTAGAILTSFYSSGKFCPGTSLMWEPSVSFTTSGRVICGFTDNPEVAVVITDLRTTFLATPSAATFSPLLNAVKGLGSVQAFPVWQATSVNFPTRLRRKRFDVNTAVANNVDTYDRSLQTAFFACVEGGPLSTNFGSFLYNDVIDVEGVTSTAT